MKESLPQTAHVEKNSQSFESFEDLISADNPDPSLKFFKHWDQDF